MAENPDRKDETCVAAYIPNGGDLRFVLRDVYDVEQGEDKAASRPLRILQRWEWSNVGSSWAWYDVHLAEDK